MWKIYDVTNGLGHTYCSDIATARRVLDCIRKQIEAHVPEVEIALNGDSFTYKPIYGCYTFRIEEVEVWNKVPDHLAEYDYV